MLAHAGDARLTLANPGRARLVVTVKRGGLVIWRRITRARAIHWTLYLRSGTYTVTIIRPGSRVARGSMSFGYHRP